MRPKQALSWARTYFTIIVTLNNAEYKSIILYCYKVSLFFNLQIPFRQIPLFVLQPVASYS